MFNKSSIHSDMVLYITQITTNVFSIVNKITLSLRSRIKLIITQKVLTIKNLTKELYDVKLKCQHLEKLLDQQRREYILKSL